MKIENRGEAFEIRYDSTDLMVPKGEMEVVDEGFATHIVKKAREWGFDVIKTGTSETKAIQPIEAIKEVVEEKVEEVKEEKPKQTTKKTKK